MWLLKQFFGTPGQWVTEWISQRLVLTTMARSQNNQVLRKACGKWKQFKRKRASLAPYSSGDLWTSWTQTIHFPISSSVWIFLKAGYGITLKEKKTRRYYPLPLQGFLNSLTKAVWVESLEGLICCFEKNINRCVLMGHVLFLSLLVRVSLFPKLDQPSCFSGRTYRAGSPEKSKKSSALSSQAHNKAAQEGLGLSMYH